MSAPARLAALAQAARGAHALHERGLLHGAVCPQAVGLCGESQAVLAPPALADGKKLVVQVGYPSLGYVDPQLLRGEGGRWSDIWGFGATLLHLLSAQPPYPGLDEMAVVQAVSQTLAAPAVALPAVPPNVADLVQASLAKDPGARPATAAEFARRLDEAVARW